MRERTVLRLAQRSCVRCAIPAKVAKIRRDLVVIGTSAGGIDALKTLLAPLPMGLPAAVCIVLHTAPHSPGVLDSILRRATRLPVQIVREAQRIVPGTVYLPPPDQHIIVEPGRIRPTRAARENRFRPAIDPLFRTAAQTYGPRVVGIILTGRLDDGTSGLWAVKRLGGTAVVQSPEDALFDAMPRNALAHVKPDYCLPLTEISDLIVRLSAERLE